ncbi:hypothetical protein vBBak6_063 [Bacillus phage v_B-Bak6]|uniref:YspA cpYpsA-related SLOG domain-containing protein n=1 Tax=Bacillus phage Basilisk TaxID=1296654 RepID=S5M446_9CAUD|nr:hypothetical protein PP653_gp095 [Bacillus phage Basilisk]AGR46616.1 hypothetical protein BASILISK_72 [Bacillus phage Basilisk]AXY83023.1 hypothetical protein vBBak1_063 [Bacillus phage v_B-Bak1]AXY83143.1 hypothetical protein vBBak6_063 [Bacillus phage v_B-Bak6]
MMKIIVAGGRKFGDYPKLKAMLDHLFVTLDKRDIEIVSGKAEGADQLGELYAKENNIPVKDFPANWTEFGKKAGAKRNKEMAMYADACICFWDGSSHGTRNMIEIAEAWKLDLRIVRY